MLENILGSAFSNLGLYMVIWWIIIAISLSWLAILIHKQESKYNN